MRTAKETVEGVQMIIVDGVRYRAEDYDGKADPADGDAEAPAAATRPRAVKTK